MAEMTRVEAYKVLERMWSETFSAEEAEALYIAQRDIEFVDLMPNDVAPVRHARWFTLTECANEGVYCSLCHKKVYKVWYAWCNKVNKVRSDYCPNCGAKMDLEVSE